MCRSVYNAKLALKVEDEAFMDRNSQRKRGVLDHCRRHSVGSSAHPGCHCSCPPRRPPVADCSSIAKTLPLIFSVYMLAMHSAVADPANSAGGTTLMAPPPAQYVTNYGRASQNRANPATTAEPAAAAPAAPVPDAVIQTGKPITATAFNQFQTFGDSLTLRPDQDAETLAFTFTNGDGGPAFQDIRITINGRSFGNVQNFTNRIFTKSASGFLRAGNNSVSVQALGPSGAKLTWKLLESKLQVTAVKPDSFGLDEAVTVEGKGFSSKAKVYIGKVAVAVASATDKKLKLAKPLPSNTPGGKQELTVVIGGKRSAPIKVKVKIAPVVTGCNFVATAFGEPLTISGKNFSTTASENVVTIGGQTCTVTAATETSLIVTAPAGSGDGLPMWNAAVKVKTNGVDSTGEVTVNIGQRVIPNDGVPQQ